MPETPNRGQELLRQRLEKLERLKALGIDPYPPRFRRTHTNQEASALFQEEEKSGRASPVVQVAGRLVALRRMGKVSFADLRDGSGKLQVHLSQERLGQKYDLLQELDLGDFLGVSGPLFRTRTGEVTVEAQDFTLLAKALRPLPEKWHGLADVEKRYRQRYLDLASREETRRIFQLRGRIILAMRSFLEARGFVEAETPILWPQAGGALARPFITYHNELERNLYLRIATELHLKRLIVGGLDKVYEIGRVFRNEGVSVRHNPEFTTLESYEAYADYNDVMRMVEEMVASIAREVLGTATITFAGTPIDLTPPWRRITLREAILQESGVDFEDYPDADALRERLASLGVPVEPWMGRGKLIDLLLDHFVEPRTMQPTFFLDYPVELSPLAKQRPDNPRLVERFEAFIAGMEIANAFTELNDPLEQRRRFQEQAGLRAAGDEEAEIADEDFLMALEHGMPPTGGLGVGIDRLVMLLTDQQSIREVILFPQLRSRE